MSEQKAVPDVTEWRKRWSHKPTPIPINAGGLWYSEECVDQMLSEYAAALTAACSRLREQVEALSKPVSDEEWDEYAIPCETDDDETLWVIERGDFESIIAARLTPPASEKEPE